MSLDGKICDTAELKHSWDSTHIQDAWIIIFSLLNNISKSNIAKGKKIEIVGCDNGEESVEDINVNKDDDEV